MEKKVFAIVPVKRLENAKTRLSTILSEDDRSRLSYMMTRETLRRLGACTQLERVIVVSSDERAKELASLHGATFLHEEKDNGVNAAVSLADKYCLDHRADASIVVPQDLPLLDPQEISTVCELAELESRCIVICPSQRYDGTNLLLRKPPSAIPTFFDSNSYENHIAEAKKNGMSVRLFMSKKLMLDVDTPEDARQLLLLQQESAGPESEPLQFLRQKVAKPVP
ncbi:MAG TPA: 2-phospho-L-lactate guanylyltransferase [Nitrososphaera sp.]|nr:2-phospho-L-lactate guanylyltransferase [Nitrososphaera sp.]